MNYQNYEEYMRSVLGYVPNTYYSDNTQSYVPQQVQTMQEENTDWYPEIYKIVYPMIKKACDDAQNDDLTLDKIDNITNIVYSNIEVGNSNVVQNTMPELRNGDVINPRAKMQQRETRGGGPNNPFLRDLIRILVLREFFDRRPHRPPFRPGMPPQRPMF